MPEAAQPKLSLTDEAVAGAKSLPELIDRAQMADPALAKALTGKALIASKTPAGVLLGTGFAYLATKYGLGWDQGLCELVAGGALLAASYVMRYVTAGRITGILTKAVPVLLAAVLLSSCTALGLTAPDLAIDCAAQGKMLKANEGVLVRLFTAERQAIDAETAVTHGYCTGALPADQTAASVAVEAGTAHIAAIIAIATLRK